MSTKKEKSSKKKEKKEKEEPAVAEVTDAPPPEMTKANETSATESKEEKREEKKTKKEKKEASGEKEEEKEEKTEEPREIKKVHRTASNVFALFTKAQIQEFKEAFTMIDQNQDGLIDPTDLQAIYEQIGLSTEFEVLKDMVEEAAGPLNFTTFLGLFGDKLKGTDSEGTLRDAFMMFDEAGKGKLSVAYVQDLLMTVGDQFSKDEMRQIWKEAPVEAGMLDYFKFVKIMKQGKDN